jgi:DNA-binding NarL/FixJ family response regulator
MSIRILLVEDQELVREGIRTLLTQEVNFDVVAEAASARETVELLRKHEPDVVLLDVGLPDVNGIELTRELLQIKPSLRILALSIHDDKRFVAGMLQAGAVGYLTKDCALDELERAIQAVHDGHSYLSPSIAGSVVEHLSVGGAPTEHRSSLEQITRRERDVLCMIAEGMTTKEIAAKLFLSPRTVETHRRNIMDKLGVRGVAELTQFAIREGLITLDNDT